MRTRDSSAGGWRAITAVVALYAFVLQVFLGTLMPLGAQGHPGPICAGLVEGGGSDQAPAEPGHGVHTLCCTSVTVLAGTDAPILASSAIVWPVTALLRPAWPDEARPHARGPPRSIPHPRGPPVV